MTKAIERATRPPMEGLRQAPFKLATKPDDDGLTLDGWAALYGVVEVIDSFEGRFRETIARGSMARSFRELPPKIQFDHGQHPVVGSIPIASLISIAEDSDPILAPTGGAHVVARLMDNWLVAPVRDAIKAGAISGMSFRFEVVREAWAYSSGEPIKDDMALIRELERTWDGSVSDDDLPLRTLRELKILEVGPVVWPAYASTSVQVRGGKIDLDRLNEPGQRELLARAVFTVDRDAAGSVARDSAARGGGVDLDASLRFIRASLADAADRRRRVAEQEKRFGLV